MLLDYSRIGEEPAEAVVTAATVPAASAAPAPDIWPFVKAGIISAIVVHYLLKMLDGGKR